MEALKVLAVADPGSIHANRFVRLLQECGCEVRVFHCGSHYVLEEHVPDTTIYVDSPGLAPLGSVRLMVARPVRTAYCRAMLPLGFLNHYGHGAWRVGRRAVRRALGQDDRPFAAPYNARAAELARVIGNWRPGLVMSLRMQNEGYTVDRARQILEGRFTGPWVHYCWGTDIELFGKDPRYAPRHEVAIRSALSACDGLIADTKRDLRQAPRFGFRGIVLGDIVATGGFDLDAVRRIRDSAPATRDVILVKGRQGDLVGRAANVLHALRRVPEAARHRVCILMASREMREALAGEFRDLRCEVLPRLGYADLLALFARTRAAVSASDVDGTPGFLIEAIATGALPVHSDMESVRDWIREGENGLLFPADNVSALAAQLKRALTDDELVARASVANWRIAQERLDRARIRVQVAEIVRRMARPS